jgi:hypothetical protein
MRDDPEQELDAEGIPVLQDTVTADGSEAVPPPKDYPQAALDFGTTSAEERRGEALADPVKREQPEWRGGQDATRVGQIIEPGAEQGLDDVESNAVGQELADPDVALSAEEAAMHVTDEP